MQSTSVAVINSVSFDVTFNLRSTSPAVISSVLFDVTFNLRSVSVAVISSVLIDVSFNLRSTSVAVKYDSYHRLVQAWLMTGEASYCLNIPHSRSHHSYDNDAVIKDNTTSYIIRSLKTFESFI